MKFTEKLKKQKLIPVLSLPSVKAGLTVASILLEHGLDACEITFRTEHAAQAIAEIKQRFPQMTLLAGTILYPEQADAAVNAGAEVMVSPGTEATIIDHCMHQGVPIIPGVCTASEIQLALSKGISVMKFFPAELSGGTKAIEAMLSIYRDISFMPTGGITAANAAQYLAIDRVLCCGATWLAPEPMLVSEDWQTVRTRVAEAAKAINEPDSP